MVDRLSNSAKLRAFELAEQIKESLGFLYYKHMDDIISGHFSQQLLMADMGKWRQRFIRMA